MASHRSTALAFLLLATLAAAQTPTPTGITRATPRPARPALVSEPGTDALIPAPESSSALRPVAGAAAGSLAFLRPAIYYSFQHGDDIPLVLGESATTSIHEVNPRLSARFADRITVAYAPTMMWYSNPRFDDEVNHRARFEAAGVFGDVDLQANQQFFRGTQHFLETGTQTNVEYWTTEGSFGYIIGPRARIDASGSQRLLYTDRFSDTRTSSAMLSFRRQVNQDLSWSVGGGGSWSGIRRGNDYASRNLRVGLRWEPSSKIDLEFTLGFDAVSFDTGDVGTRTEPRHEFTLAYQIATPTYLAVSATRATDPSFFGDQFVDSSNLSVNLRQQLLGKIEAVVEAARREQRYRGNLVSTASRSDTYTLYRVSIRGRLFGRYPVSVSWQHRDTQSNISFYKRTGSLIGASLGWEY